MTIAALVAVAPSCASGDGGDHDPVALGEGVGQVLAWPPDVDPEDAGVAVAPLAVLLDALATRT
jgi:hypothetical protein